MLTVALFLGGLKFAENRHNPAEFEPYAGGSRAAGGKSRKPATSGIYTVEVEGETLWSKSATAAISASSLLPPVFRTGSDAAPASTGTPTTAPLAGNIWKVIATEGQTVAEGDDAADSGSHEDRQTAYRAGWDGNRGEVGTRNLCRHFT